jgi:hypothetical protein
MSLQGVRIPENFSSKYFLNSALILSGNLKKGGNESKDEFETQFKTNPIWSSPYTIDIDVPKTCPFEAGTIKVTVKFALSMDATRPQNTPPASPTPGASKFDMVRKPTLGDLQRHDSSEPNRANGYKGIRVHIKPLNGKGETGDTEFLISDNNSTWEIHNVVEIDPDNDVGGHEKNIENGKFTAINKMEIPCTSAWSRDQWDAEKHQKGKDRTSYAVIVSHILDMNRNVLNPIAKTFTIDQKGSVHPRDLHDRGEVRTGSGKTQGGSSGGSSSGTTSGGSQSGSTGGFGMPVFIAQFCSSRSTDICKKNGATCQVLVAKNGAKKDVCRWVSRKTKAQCKTTLGLWTLANSRYAKNHPQAVLKNTKGACISEVTNIKN